MRSKCPCVPLEGAEGVDIWWFENHWSRESSSYHSHCDRVTLYWFIMEVFSGFFFKPRPAAKPICPLGATKLKMSWSVTAQWLQPRVWKDNTSDRSRLRTWELRLTEDILVCVSWSRGGGEPPGGRDRSGVFSRRRGWRYDNDNHNFFKSSDNITASMEK